MWQQTKNIYHFAVAFTAHIFYRFPSRKLIVIGVTGTSGKTTTAHMIYEILKQAGYKVGILSTIKAVIGGKEYDTGFHVTTPDAHVLPKYLNLAKNSGDTHIVLEVSSHALDQHRAAFIRFDIGVLTTLAHEHLDYHKTFENYARAKFKLLHSAKHAITPFMGFSPEIKAIVGFDKLKGKITTYGIAQGDQTQKDWQLRLAMPGKFNLLNALAAATVGKLLGISEKTIKNALSKIASLPGRFEEVPTGKKFRVVIDFAHKPDALEEVLQAIQEEKKGGRVIVMFGCASQRDVLKRPMMGKISARLADITVLTDEDPRFEESMKILNEIVKGCEDAGARELLITNYEIKNTLDHVFFKIPDRKEAIMFVIKKLAKKGDIVVLCGKGHEKSINYKGIEKPWSEYAVVMEALEE